MARPRCCRRVGCAPDTRYFKPVGAPLRDLEEVRLGLDEFEALRQEDLLGVYQVEAALVMGVSRATFARIIENAGPRPFRPFRKRK